MAHRCPDCGTAQYRPLVAAALARHFARADDSALLGYTIASAVVDAISDACAERDCDNSTDANPCPCDANPGGTLYFAVFYPDLRLPPSRPAGQSDQLPGRGDREPDAS